MKLRQFQTILAQKKIDLAFFTFNDPSLTYFLQTELTGGYLFVTPQKAFLLCSPLDAPPRQKGIQTHPLSVGWEKRYLNSTARRVGINKTILTVGLLEKIKKLFPRAVMIDLSPDLQQLRQEKTSSELRLIGQACQLTSAAFQALLAELPGQVLRTEQDVALFLEAHIRKNGGSLAFPTIVAMGKNASTPHHCTSLTRLRRGFLLLDFGARVRGYCADMTRIIFLGKPTRTEEEYYSLLLQAQKDAISAVKDGVLFSELDASARQRLGKQAVRFTHSLGHGIGIEVHEAPIFSQKSSSVQKNVPFTIEPGIYFPKKFGLRIEDTVVWDGKKVKILTSAAKELAIIKKN